MAPKSSADAVRQWPMVSTAPTSQRAEVCQVTSVVSLVPRSRRLRMIVMANDTLPTSANSDASDSDAVDGRS